VLEVLIAALGSTPYTKTGKYPVNAFVWRSGRFFPTTGSGNGLRKPLPVVAAVSVPRQI